MNLKDELIRLRADTGMNRREFAEFFGIPYRTVLDWELGKREMPDYLFRLMKYRLAAENYTRGDSGDGGQTECNEDH